MIETKLPRLLAAAKEFNIGQDTLVEFLANKGFPKDELKPTAKLSPEMYLALQREFQSDKVAKAKSDMIDLPKGSAEARKRKDEEDLSFRKIDRPSHLPAQDIAVIVPIEPNIAIEEIVEMYKVEETVEVPLPPLPAEIEQPILEPIQRIIVPEPKPVNPQFLRMEAEIEGPKIVGVIDLKSIGKPRPTPIPVAIEPPPITIISEEPPVAIVPVEPPVEIVAVEPPIVIVPVEPPVAIINLDPAVAIFPVESPAAIFPVEPLVAIASVEPPVTIVPLEPPVIISSVEQPSPLNGPLPIAEPVEVVLPKPGEKLPEPERIIENIQAQRLSGPKIVGKIVLNNIPDNRPKEDPDLKRKRKRIPVGPESKSTTDQRQPAQPDRRPPFNRPAQPGAPGVPNRNPGPPNQRPGGNVQNRPNQGGGNFQNRPNQGGNFQNRPNQGGSFQNRPNQGGNFRPQDRVIDEKEIQEKLKETQARLAAGTGQNKASRTRSKLRKERKRELLEQEGESSRTNILEVTEFISASELANLMDVSPTEVVAKCFSLGLMVSINQRLDAEVIELVASEFGVDVKFVNLDDQEVDEDLDEDDLENLSPRAPIVTIMGHVDHGKTSLLDHIRSASVAKGEAGGITQHIGAYEVKTSAGKTITFLDTPGHEAFTAMRARGAKVTDIAVIVIAADDAVMPQTKEAISHAQAANVPMIFAVNKIDKDGANPQKIYEQLSGLNLLVEEWGGKYQSQEISAKQGLNIDILLEKILLEAEIQDLKANPDREGLGTIVEASLDKGRGYVATLLVQNGTLEVGDVVVSGQYFGRVKAMFNEKNEKIEIAGPSSPALILGLNGAPQAGEKFKVYEDEADAKQVAYKRGQILREQGMRARKHITLDEIGRRLALGNFKELNVIIKGDVDGSVEALSDSLQKLSTEEIVVKVILKGVGAISENDVTLASASDAIIIGFNVRPNNQASRLAENEGIEIKQYSVIYNAINDVKAAMEGLLEPNVEEKEVASVEIKEVFKFDKATVAGCFVISGKIKRDSKIRLFRDGVLIYPRTEGAFAELGSLKRYKDDVKDVVVNMECGLTIKNFIDIQQGDLVVAIEVNEVKRNL